METEDAESYEQQFKYLGIKAGVLYKYLGIIRGIFTIYLLYILIQLTYVSVDRAPR